jgi:hypothetical protein
MCNFLWAVRGRPLCLCLGLARAVYICCIYIYIGLTRTVYIHRIWTYIWWFPCQEYRMHTIYIWFWPTLHIYNTLSREVTKCMVIYGVHIRFCPTLLVAHASFKHLFPSPLFFVGSIQAKQAHKQAVCASNLGWNCVLYSSASTPEVKSQCFITRLE